MEGFIKLNRKLLDWEWFDDSHMVHLWIYLLMKANHENIKWHGLTIERGQFVFGRDKAAADTGISVRSIRTCLDRFVELEQIDLKTTNKFTIVTICNYDRYQCFETIERPENDQQTTSKRPANDQQTTTNKNDKNEKNNNINNNNCACVHAHEEDDSLTWLSDYWNTKTNGIFNEIPDLTEAYAKRSYYAKKLIAAWGKEKITEAIDKMVRSPYLTSQGQRRYATFDWLLGSNPMNIEKVLSGNFDELYGSTPSAPSYSASEERTISSRGVEPIRRLDAKRKIDATGVIFTDDLRTSIIGLEDERVGQNGYEPRRLLPKWVCDPQYGMHGETTYNGRRYWITRWHTIVVGDNEVKV